MRHPRHHRRQSDHVTMSLGAFMAAEEQACTSLYVTTVYKDGKSDISTAQLKAISEPQP